MSVQNLICLMCTKSKSSDNDTAQKTLQVTGLSLEGLGGSADSDRESTAECNFIHSRDLKFDNSDDQIWNVLEETLENKGYDSSSGNSSDESDVEEHDLRADIAAWAIQCNIPLTSLTKLFSSYNHPPNPTTYRSS